jgi:hypothetical protein
MWWNANLRNGCLGTCLLFALQNRRPDYIEAFFNNVINWTEVSRRFASEKIKYKLELEVQKRMANSNRI